MISTLFSSLLIHTSTGSLQITLVIASIGVFISTLEDLFCSRLFRDDQILSWKVFRLRSKLSSFGSTAQTLNLLFLYDVYRLILVSTLVASSLMPFTLAIHELLLPLVFIILIGIVLSFIRNVYGLDGSDHMNLIVFSAAFVGILAPELSIIQLASMWFISIQYCLSILIAGIAKVASTTWRSGNALVGIMSSGPYGNDKMYDILLTHSSLSRCLSFSIIIFECTFWIIFFVPQEMRPLIIFLGIAFHTAICIVMGLNNFFWAFISTYPTIWFCLQLLK